MRLLKILLPLLLLAYGGTMGYLWYSVKDSADDMVKGAAPFARITYGSIHVSPMGDELGIDNIVIQSHMTSDEFRIDKVRLTAPHVGYFLRTAIHLKKKQPPEYLSMQLQGVKFDIGGELFDVIDKAQSQPSGPTSAAYDQGRAIGEFISSLDALGCGEVERFAISDLRAMGLGAMNADFGLKIEYNKALNRTHMTGNIHIDNIYELEMGVDLAARPDRLSGPVSFSAEPKFSVNYRDLGFHKVRNKYCASLNDSSVEDYVTRHSQLLGEALHATLPEETLKAYQQAMLKGGSFVLRIEPQQSLDMEGLPYYSGGDIVQMLGLSLRINGTRVEMDQITWGKPKQSTATTTREEATQPASVPPAASVQAQPAQELSIRDIPFKKVAVRDAAKYVDKFAEVTTTEGKIRRGVVSEVNNGRIYLVLKISSGSLTYPIAFEDVEMLRVRQ